MLPYTPLQYLLFHEAAGRPAGTAWLAAPQDARAGDDQRQSRRRAAGDRQRRGRRAARRHRRRVPRARPRHRRRAATTACCAPRRTSGARHSSSSAARAATRRARSGSRAPGRRSLALGGYFKNTVCVTRGDEAFVSQHIGDLDNAPTCAALDEAVAHSSRSSTSSRQVVAHDLHPDFYSTRHAARLAARLGRAAARRPAPPRAHRRGRRRAPRRAARCSGSRSTASASAPTARAWGGELLRVDGARCERLGPACARCACRAAIAPRASRGAWPRRRCALRAAATRSRRASPTSRPRRPSRRCSRAASMRRRRAAWAAGSTPRRGCSACSGAWPSKARRRCCSKASPSGTARSPPIASLYAIAPDERARPRRRSLMRLADERDAGFGAALFHATLVAALADWVARAARAHGIAHRRRAAAAASSTRSSRAACAPRSRRAASTCSRRRRCRPTTAAWRSARRGSRCSAIDAERLTMCLALPARVVDAARARHRR